MRDDQDIALALIRRIAAREKAALGELYDRYSGAVLGLLVKVTRHDAVAEDLLQEVFLKIWEKAADYDASKGRLFTWILNIARNKGIDYLRSAEHKRTVKIQNDDSDVGKLNAGSGAAVTTQKPEHIGMRDHVATLPEEQQEVIQLLYYRGFTQQEAAEELGIPLGTVKTRSRLALKALRSLFTA